MLGSSQLGAAYLGFASTGSTGSPTAVRVSQAAFEVLHDIPSNAVVSQLTAEVLHDIHTDAVLSQLAVEVLIPYRPGHARFWAQIV